MSEELKHKLIHYEAPPPNAVWNAIAAQLDEDKQFAAVSAKIADTELTPPDAAWTNIAARLDDAKQYASIATRLHAFEAMPPRSAWINITARLDDDTQYDSVATKFKNFEAAPPPLAWNNIAEALTDTKEESKPLLNIRRTIFRLAVAAVFACVFIGAWLLIDKSPKTDLAKNKQEKKSTGTVTKEKQESIAPNDSNSQKIEEVATVNQPLLDNKNKNHPPVPALTVENSNEIALKHAVVNDLPTYQEKPIVIHSAPILDKEGNLIADMDVLTTSNYIVVMGPNGQTTRISAKFASIIRFLNSNSDDPAGTEEYLDKVIKESDTWKKRFQEWRSKISQSSFIPSASNFLDIVEFKELIEENK